MRKDHIRSEGDCSTESEFVEQYWTKVWEQEGGPKAQIEKVGRANEMQVMEPYLAAMTSKRVLDIGCGLGDWVMYFQDRGFDITGLDISQKTISNLKSTFNGYDFQVGDNVEHSIFGAGKIMALSGSGENQRVGVVFNDGTRKKLIVKFANLKKI